MNRVYKKLANRGLRAHRVRARILGTKDRPRLTVFVSNIHVSAQLIDDETHATLGYATTVGQKTLKGTMTEKAIWVGTEIAKVAGTKKVKAVIFDRGARKYHGRVKALADAARAAGLEF